jgi:RimJ/RimL family protein N-acetyltransferase
MNNWFIQQERHFETLETDRCLLYPMSQKFAEDILAICTLDVCQYFDEPIHQDIKEIRKQIEQREQEKNEQRCVNIAICDKEGRFIGNTEVRHINTWELSMGIWLWIAHQHIWLWSEVISAVLNWIKENLSFKHIKRECYAANLGSIKIIESLGGKLATTKKTKHWKYGEIDDRIYHIYPDLA